MWNYFLETGLIWSNFETCAAAKQNEPTCVHVILDLKFQTFLTNEIRQKQLLTNMPTNASTAIAVVFLILQKLADT